MGNVISGMSVSLDGYIAGPGDDLSRLHRWLFEGSDEANALLGEFVEGIGAVVMGKRMYTVAEKLGAFEDDSFTPPHFVLTHETPATVPQNGPPFTFVNDGVEAAIAQAKAAAGDKNTVVMGGANLFQQCLNAGLLDEVQVQLIPVVLGDGIRWFENVTPGIELEKIKLTEIPGATFIDYRVVK
jgi:dihydrofolate reductase